MRGRTLSAIAAMERFSTHFSAKDRLLKAAEIELRTLTPEALRLGPDFALLVTEAQSIAPDGLTPEDARKLARLKPTDPWVEVTDIDDLLASIGQEHAGDLPEAVFAPLRPGVREDPPAGAVRIIVITGAVFETFCAEVTPVMSATRGRTS